MILDKTSTDQLISTVLSLKPTDKEVIFLMVGEQTKLDYDRLIKTLNQKKIHFLGAIFPFVFYQKEKTNDGVLIKKFPLHTPPQVIRNFTKNNFQIPSIHLTSKIKATVFTFVDGLSQNIASFLRALYNEGGRIDFHNKTLIVSTLH